MLKQQKHEVLDPIVMLARQQKEIVGLIEQQQEAIKQLQEVAKLWLETELARRRES